MAKLPPSIHDLLEIPEFRRMMKVNPWMPPSMKWGNPWRLWALKESGVWVTKEYPTYGDAWRVALQAIRADYPDVCIVNKRHLTPIPRALDRALVTASFGRWWWCARCRRPTYFGAYTEKHHALKLQPTLTEDEPFRCYYCGIRRAMVKEYQ